MEPTDYKDIIWEFRNHTVYLTINRPERRNALSPRARAELTDGIKRAGSDPTVAAIVIRGAGDKAFCAGGDLAYERGLVPEGMSADIWACIEAIRRSRVPVIAAVKGFAVGSGNWLAYLCDLTVAADNAIFAQAGAKIGSTAAGFFVAYLSRIVGEKKAREIWYLCHRYSAQEALDMKLINFVYPLAEFDARLDALCDELVHRSPTTIKLLKTTFDMAIDPIRSMRDDYLLTLIAPDYAERGELHEGVAAFKEKREPDYSKWRQPRGAQPVAEHAD
jgi:dihydroxynaphthoic acid synthetase